MALTDSNNLISDDSFLLYDLHIEIVASERKMVCNHKVGDYFEVSGENMSIPANQSFSLYAMAAILPLIPAKQRMTHKNDWMTTDTDVACPDPNCGAIFRITRVNTRKFRHSEVTVTSLKDAEK